MFYISVRELRSTQFLQSASKMSHYHFSSVPRNMSSLWWREPRGCPSCVAGTPGRQRAWKSARTEPRFRSGMRGWRSTLNG